MKHLKKFESWVDDVLSKASENIVIEDDNGFFEFEVTDISKEPINYYIYGNLTVPSGSEYKGHITYNYLSDECYHGFESDIIDDIEGIYKELEVFMEQVVDYLNLRGK